MGHYNRVKKSIWNRRKLASMIKDALDNLPSGICYFDRRGVPLLVNRTMHQLVLKLTGNTVQDISDFDDILTASHEVFTEDGGIWQFQKKAAGEQGQYIEIIASDITALYEKKRELENITAEQNKIRKHLEEISKNVVSITRNEEILAMKMNIHSELGYALAETRQFISRNCSPEEKSAYITEHRRVAKKLLGEIGNDDEIDIFSELNANAEKLGVRIVLEGKIAKFAEGLMTKVVRECLINTIRHGEGDKVFVKVSESPKWFTAVITNNGRAPESTIREGGGLLSLRRNIEAAGGAMHIESIPEFVMTITLPTQWENRHNRV